MNIYLDSARVAAWTLPAGCPPVRGVTTNPTLIHQAGISVTLDSYEALVQAVADQGMAELMLQLPMSEPAEARRWQARLHTQARRVGVQLTIKLPCHPDWLAVIHAMREAAQPVLLTGLSNPVQLLWAHALNAAFVAPYVGRLVADGRDVWPLMQACVALQADKGPALLAASIKSPEVLARLIACGAAAVTLPPESLAAWAGDALTDTAIAQFARDAAASQTHPPHTT